LSHVVTWALRALEDGCCHTTAIQTMDIIGEFKKHRLQSIARHLRYPSVLSWYLCFQQPDAWMNMLMVKASNIA
jgi:hypothetical protein